MKHCCILIFLLCCISCFVVTGLSFAQNSSGSDFLKETFNISEQEMAAYLKQIAVKDPQKYASLMKTKADNEEQFEVMLLQGMVQGQSGVERLGEPSHSETQEFLTNLSRKNYRTYKVITQMQQKDPQQANLLIMQEMMVERSRAALLGMTK